MRWAQSRKSKCVCDSRPQDYFKGEIQLQGQKVCDISGTYLGFMDFSGLRYFDGRQSASVTSAILPEEKLLGSDSLFRLDSKTLEKGNIDEAQKEKELIEQSQRADRKLREAVAERRKQGGRKFASIF